MKFKTTAIHKIRVVLTASQIQNNTKRNETKANAVWLDYTHTEVGIIYLTQHVQHLMKFVFVFTLKTHIIPTEETTTTILCVGFQFGQKCLHQINVRFDANSNVDAIL